MIIHSILFQKAEERISEESREAPIFFVDLNLDQVIQSVTAGKQEYHLKPYFYTPLKDIDAVLYRHEVMRDLEIGDLLARIRSFAKQMRSMRESLARAEKMYYRFQKERWFLDAVEIYCAGVSELAQSLSAADLHSRGFLAFREFLDGYTHSNRFTSLVAETKRLLADLASVQYALVIKEDRIRVRRYDGEIDESEAVLATFEKFKQGEVKDRLVEFSDGQEMNHIEAKILDLVGLLYPEIFSRLDQFRENNDDFQDETIQVFDREIQFYMAYLNYMAPVKQAGLFFCYPQLSNPGKEVFSREGFDLALAYQRVLQKATLVCNDFELYGAERIIVVSGPNQGGKTTFARAFGQLHYLASLGLPVPGREARLFLCDRLFTHFEKEEALQNLRGKLEDDLVRIHAILDHATPQSIIILNEIFTSTTLKDAVFLGKKVLEKISQLDQLCVCVTFLDELSSLNGKTVSMVSTVFPDNPTLRTFKILRRPADGRSYAVSIAEKYRLTYSDLKRRVAQ